MLWLKYQFSQNIMNVISCFKIARKKIRQPSFNIFIIVNECKVNLGICSTRGSISNAINWSYRWLKFKINMKSCVSARFYCIFSAFLLNIIYYNKSQLLEQAIYYMMIVHAPWKIFPLVQTERGSL